MPVSSTATNASSSATALASSERCVPRGGGGVDVGASGAAAARARCSPASEVARLAQSSSAARGRSGGSVAGLSVIRTLTLVTRQPLAQLRELAAADGERLGLAAQPQHVAIVVADALEGLDVRNRNENAAVRAYEVVLELLLEVLQRLVDEVLAAAVT